MHSGSTCRRVPLALPAQHPQAMRAGCSCLQAARSAALAQPRQSWLAQQHAEHWAPFWPSAALWLWPAAADVCVLVHAADEAGQGRQTPWNGQQVQLLSGRLQLGSPTAQLCPLILACSQVSHQLQDTSKTMVERILPACTGLDVALSRKDRLIPHHPKPRTSAHSSESTTAASYDSTA